MVLRLIHTGTEIKWTSLAEGVLIILVCYSYQVVVKIERHRFRLFSEYE